MNRLPIAKTSYYFESNSNLNQSKHNDESLEVSHLAVKEEIVAKFGISHKKIIFFSSDKVDGKDIFNDSSYREKIITDTKLVKEHLESHLRKNLKASDAYFVFLENTLFLNVSIPRPHTQDEKEIHDEYRSISETVSKLSSSLKEKKLTLNLVENILLNLDKNKLTEKEMVNILNAIDEKKLSEREMKNILISLVKKSSDDEFKTIENSNVKLNNDGYMSLKTKLESKKNELTNDIQILKTDLEPKVIESQLLEIKSIKAQDQSVKDGIKINLVNGIDFKDLAIKFKLKMRNPEKEIVKSKKVEFDSSAEKNPITSRSNSNNSSNSEVSLSDSNQTNEPVNWKSVTASPKQKPRDFLKSNQPKTPFISSNSNTITNTNNLPIEENITSPLENKTRPRSPGMTVKPRANIANQDSAIQNSANSTLSNSTQSISSTSNTASIGGTTDITTDEPNNNPPNTADNKTIPRHVKRGLLSDI